MKRILIIDESEVIRETLALILGRDYIVSKRALGGQQFRFADAPEETDLLILGVAPQFVALEHLKVDEAGGEYAHPQEHGGIKETEPILKLPDLLFLPEERHLRPRWRTGIRPPHCPPTPRESRDGGRLRSA